MKGGRKNLKRAAEEDKFNLQDGQTIMQVLSLRGSNLIEGQQRRRRLQTEKGAILTYVGVGFGFTVRFLGRRRAELAGQFVVLTV
ncbi:hypothetical protein I3843_02G010800 [Carya illinoinensis]|nr:hypothetical protein I3843_02G010800 [Carya illinoinensis]